MKFVQGDFKYFRRNFKKNISILKTASIYKESSISLGGILLKPNKNSGKLAEDFHALTEEENDELQSTCGIWKKDDFGTEPELQSSFDTNTYQRSAIQKQKIKVVTKKPIHRVVTPKTDAGRKKRKAGMM